MNLADYFEKKQGRGVLATADVNGKVDIAYYSRPHVTDEETVAFIMNDHRSHDNIISNPNAAYLFTEQNSTTDSPLQGVRLYLTMTGEEKDSERLYQLKRRSTDDNKGPRFLVFFHVDSVRPLVGDGEFGN